MAPGQQAECESILRALPEWFGIESALLQYVQDIRRYPTWLARTVEPASGRAAEQARSTGAIGFITIRRHYPESAEIHCMAVRPAMHRRGIGRAMIECIERTLRGEGARFLQVKTLGPSRPDPGYALTHRFYAAMGFAPLEEFPTLWERNPALQLVKAL